MKTQSNSNAGGRRSRRLVRQVDYGDFTEYQVRCLVADYCRDITTGMCGWGVSFRDWVELRGIAKPGKLFQLFRLPNDQGHSLRVGETKGGSELQRLADFLNTKATEKEAQPSQKPSQEALTEARAPDRRLPLPLLPIPPHDHQDRECAQV